MAKQISWGFTGVDTAISGVTELDFPRGLVNFGDDFIVESQNGKEVILTHIRTPRTLPERFRIGRTTLSNIFAGTGVDPAVDSTKKGIQLLLQLTDVMSITDSVDATIRNDYPVSIHAVIKIPAIDDLTSTMVLTLLGRLVSGFFATGDLTATRLESLSRGALVPSDI